MNGKFTTLDDPNADDTVSTPYAGPGTSEWGSSMTGEITGYYPDKTASHTTHGFVYADGRWTTVDCPDGHGYVGSALYYVGDYGREMLAQCFTANFATVDWYMYTPDRTFSSAAANFTLLPPPPGAAPPGAYEYNFVNDLGLAGGIEQVANPSANGCGPVLLDAFRLRATAAWIDREGAANLRLPLLRRRRSAARFVAGVDLRRYCGRWHASGSCASRLAYARRRRRDRHRRRCCFPCRGGLGSGPSPDTAR